MSYSADFRPVNADGTPSGRGPSGRGREIIRLRHECGMKQAAIAARLKMSVASVKQTLRRHRRRIANF